jgi:thermostable 8-oxoguanine DNA glycosylase
LLPYSPKATPSGQRYLTLEANFLAEARKRGMSPADLDLAIWKEKSQSVAFYRLK